MQVPDKPRDSDGRELVVGQVVELLDFRSNLALFNGTGMSNTMVKFIGVKGPIRLLKPNPSQWNNYPCWVFHFEDHPGRSLSGNNLSYFYFATECCRMVNRGLKGLAQRYQEEARV